jgi:hypothetical protein
MEDDEDGDDGYAEDFWEEQYFGWANTVPNPNGTHFALRFDLNPWYIRT